MKKNKIFIIKEGLIFFLKMNENTRHRYNTSVNDYKVAKERKRKTDLIYDKSIQKLFISNQYVIRDEIIEKLVKNCGDDLFVEYIKKIKKLEYDDCFTLFYDNEIIQKCWSNKGFFIKIKNRLAF